MNIFRAGWCRAYQLGFRTALPVLPYRTPEELDSVFEIPIRLRQLGIGSVLLVTDKQLRSLGLTASLEKELGNDGITCQVYDSTRSNPTVANVEEALRLYEAGNCGAIIGFGGGSAMDCAKAVGARVAWPRRSVQDLGGILRIWKKIPPLFAVPTTAGTGSETTLAAVIVDEKTRHKFTMNDFPLIPRYAVLDAYITVKLPPFYTATTGIDALTHAVEAYIGQTTTKETRAYSIEAVQLIMKYLERAYQNGEDIEARQAMLRASYLAGMAFTKSYVGYCHAVAHSLGGMYDIPHGLANSVLLPYVLRSYGKRVYKPLKELAVAAKLARAESIPPVAAELFIRKIERMNKNMGIPDKLSGIRAEDIKLLAFRADLEGNPLYPVPKLMDAEELQQFYVMVADDLSGAKKKEEATHAGS